MPTNLRPCILCQSRGRVACVASPLGTLHPRRPSETACGRKPLRRPVLVLVGLASLALPIPSAAQDPSWCDAVHPPAGAVCWTGRRDEPRRVDLERAAAMMRRVGRACAHFAMPGFDPESQHVRELGDSAANRLIHIVFGPSGRIAWFSLDASADGINGCVARGIRRAVRVPRFQRRARVFVMFPLSHAWIGSGTDRF